jgi:hypothetical protein
MSAQIAFNLREKNQFLRFASGVYVVISSF